MKLCRTCGRPSAEFICSPCLAEARRAETPTTKEEVYPNPDIRAELLLRMMSGASSDSILDSILSDFNVTPKDKELPNQWSDEWPTRPGHYWFYGWLSSVGLNLKAKPNLSLVEAYGTTTTGMTYQTEGNYLWKSGGGIGKWQKAILPQLPKPERN